MINKKVKIVLIIAAVIAVSSIALVICFSKETSVNHRKSLKDMFLEN